MKDTPFKMKLQLLADDNSGDNAPTDNPVQKETENNNSEGKKQNEKKYTDDEVDEIINKKFEKWTKQKEKEMNEAKKLADMTAQEKVEYERNQLKKELEELRNANTISEMSKTARGILKERNIDISDELLSMLVTKEADTTKKNVEGFAEMFDKAVEKAVNEKLKGNPPKKGPGNKTLTKEDILNIKDRTERQRKIAENIELFN